MRVLRVAPLVAILVLQTVLASAQPVRDQLISRAAVARDAGDHARALDLLRAAWRIAPSLSLRWGIAFEAYQVGDLAAARVEATACLNEAAGAQASIARDQCQEILDRVVDRERAGAAPSARTVGTPGPVEPTPRPVPERRRPVAARGPGPWPAVLLGVGLAGLAASGVFFGVRASALAPCRIDGDTAYCPDANALHRAEDAPVWGTIARTALIAGSALAVGGVLWMVLGRPRAGRTTVGVGPEGIVLAGRF